MNCLTILKLSTPWALGFRASHLALLTRTPCYLANRARERETQTLLQAHNHSPPWVPSSFVAGVIGSE